MIENLVHTQIPTIPSIDALDAGMVAGLQRIPGLIVEHPDFGMFTLQGREVRRRTDLVGRKLANLTSGIYTSELDGRDVFTGVPDHLDGDAGPYFQLNTGRLAGDKPEKGSVVGARFTIKIFKLEEPVEQELFNEIALRRPRPRSFNSTFNLNSCNGRVGIVDSLHRRGKKPPALVGVFEGFVPVGATIIFGNGTDDTSKLLRTHTTRSAYMKDGQIRDTSMFWRKVSLGRVEIPGGSLMNPTNPAEFVVK